MTWRSKVGIDGADLRRDILVKWMVDNGRGPIWLARRIRYSRPYISRVLNDLDPFTDKLVGILENEVGVSFPKKERGMEWMIEQIVFRRVAVYEIEDPDSHVQIGIVELEAEYGNDVSAKGYHVTLTPAAPNRLRERAFFGSWEQLDAYLQGIGIGARIFGGVRSRIPSVPRP